MSASRWTPCSGQGLRLKSFYLLKPQRSKAGSGRYSWVHFPSVLPGGEQQDNSETGD